VNVAAPLALGAAFGWSLHKAGLGRYETVAGAFSFRDLTMMRFLAASLAVAVLGVHALAALGLAGPLPVPRSALLADAIGGALFGASMALTGFCPATVAAGAAEGRLDHLIAGGLGLYLGAVLFGLAYPYVVPATTAIGDLGATTAARALGVSPWLLVVLVIELAALAIWILERAGRRGGAARDGHAA
jgi:uncharacterized protein